MKKRITDIPVRFPKMEYCTDNAAMISIAGYFKFQKTKKVDDLMLNGKSRLNLVEE